MKSDQYLPPHDTYLALGCHVLVVVKAGNVGDWTAYIDAVPGHNHKFEAEEVKRTGDKISKQLACVLFPYFNPDLWRD